MKSFFRSLLAALPLVPGRSRRLGNLLWGGYASSALPELETRAGSASASQAERREAIWHLMSWAYCLGHYEAALRTAGRLPGFSARPERRFTMLRAQCLIQLGRPAEALAEIDAFESRRAGAVDIDLTFLRSTAVRHLALSGGRTQAEAEAHQLHVLNQALQICRLAAVSVRDPSAPLSLGNLTAIAPPSKNSAGRKVSVIMPAFNATRTIASALQSLLAQTHSHLEILVVDDCSSDDTAEQVAGLAAADPRIRLIRQLENRGTYAARNRGLQDVTGDFITTHDADDWSHPQKIERQLATLSAHPEAVAVTSRWLRVLDSLEVAGAWRPRKKTLLDPNDSSLLFPRSLLARLGGWDPVRVSADSEFRERIVALWGRRAVVCVDDALSFALVRSESLTRSGATHIRSAAFGLRWHYLDAYRWWHRTRRRTLPPLEPTAARPFPTPFNNDSDAPRPSAAFPLLVVADFTRPDAARLVRDVTARLGHDACGALALYHWREYPGDPTQSLHPGIYELATEFHFPFVTVGTVVRVHVTLIAGPALLRHPPDATPEISTSELLVMESPPSCRIEDRALAAARAIFGCEGRLRSRTVALATAADAVATKPAASRP